MNNSYRSSNKKRKKKGIIFRQTKYLFIIVLILLVIVFIFSRCHKVDESAETPDSVSSSESRSESALSETDTPSSSSENITSAETADTTESTNSAEQISETTTAASEKADNMDNDIDNEWAMFLVNNDNPLPDDYDDQISTSLVYSGSKNCYMDSRMADYMIRMIADAEADGINLNVISAYRTIEYQQNNFDNSVQQRINNGMTYDEAYADTMREVAFPGKSEHNAGLSADIFSDEYVSLDDDGFKNTKAYAWLDEHAADYGFILRYPEGKDDITGFVYEPWHYRFVGVYYAKKVKASGLCLEEYFESMGWLDENGTAIAMTGPVTNSSAAETKSTDPEIIVSDGGVTIIV